MSSEPFDRQLPSPIASILELGARAPGSVVTTSGFSDLQRESYVRSSIEERIIDLVSASDRPDLIVVSGSAGGGKSALIASLLAQRKDLFNEDVVFDATHSERPEVTQAAKLSKFFQPFADGVQEPPGDLPRLIAANTGMLILLFDQLRQDGGGFQCLESTLKSKLGIPSAVSDINPPWSAVVVNLDLRPTAGSDEALVAGMISFLDFDSNDGLLHGAPRCKTCKVRSHCPVRTNSQIINASEKSIDALLSVASLRRGRHEPPRSLWDFLSRALTGDDTFSSHNDPCDAVAAAADRGDKEWVFEHLLPRKLFDLGGETGKRVAELDPSLRPTKRAHESLATAGIRPDRDALTLSKVPGAGEALLHAEDLARAGEIEPSTLGRSLITAGFLTDSDAWEFRDQSDIDFQAMLWEYEKHSSDPNGDFPHLWELPQLLEEAIGKALGVQLGSASYVPTKAYDPRQQSRVFAKIDLMSDDFRIVDDPAVDRESVGAELVGHHPISISVNLGGVFVSMTLPTFRLLRGARVGTVASTADLERFYALRRAVEALARQASDRDKDSFLIETPQSGERYLVRRSQDGNRRLFLRKPS